MFTRYSSTSEKELFGEYLSEAGGEDMVGGGLRNP
jgi:phosphoenolpyruvate synthase/pyruvate phosphate dikinase